MAQYDSRNPRIRLRRVIRNNMHWAWIIPFSMVENFPSLFSGVFNVLLQYLIAVRHSVDNMNQFHEIYRRESDDDDDPLDDTDDDESVSGESRVSSGSRMSTRSMSKKKN